jgi:tRNA modification GTPase
VFRSPNSYTGIDTVEISCHGGIYIFSKINDLLMKIGAVPAEPGEFTRLAFLNGKIDLVQAEAVGEIIRSRSDAAGKLLLKQLTGEFSAKISELRNELINYCSLLELELDFTEENIELISKEELIRKIDIIIENIKRITDTYETGKIISNGINLAIVGKPNVGKSSIFNYLLNQSRSIVSEIPGTTRDYIKEPLIIGDYHYNLIDTAGIRDSDDPIEREGVSLSKKILESSDIIIHVREASEFVNNGMHSAPNVINLYNKFDLIADEDRRRFKGFLAISAKTGENMDILKNKIIDLTKKITKNDSTSDIIITNQRHRHCLLKSCEYLVKARELLINNQGNELISFEVREAMRSISEIIGDVKNVDILNNIFKKFCIGK